MCPLNTVNATSILRR